MTTAIVLPCPAAVAAGLAMPGGLGADDLHVTLAVLAGDDPSPERRAELGALVERFAARTPPVAAVLSGVGRFSGDDRDAVHLCVDSAALAAVRPILVAELETAGFPVGATHGFDPHMTLAYVAHETASPIERFGPMALTFERLALWAGDFRAASPFASPGTSMSRAAPKNLQRLAPIALSASPVDGTAEGRWNVLAYEVSLKASGVKLTRADFEACVRNFASYPKAPIVIEHADTHGGPAEWAEPHGWVAALRVGTFTRPDGRVVASLEGLTQPDAATREAMTSAPGKPAKWPFGSVTVFRGHDEERDEPLGMCLWSFSLTAHPRLVDVPRLAASLAPDFHDTRGAAAQEIPMKTFLALAAMFGIAASTEEDAEKKLEAFATQGAEDARATRDALKLSVNAPRAEVLGAITALSTAAAKVPALEAKVGEFEKAAAERFAADVKTHVDDYIAAGGPEREASRAALEAFARADYAAFSKAYPRPSAAEKKERAQDAKRFASIGGGKSAKAPAPKETTDQIGASDMIAAAERLCSEAEAQGTYLSFSEAMRMVESGDEQFDEPSALAADEDEAGED